MAISTTANRISYSGNGVTTSFSFPYSFLEAADLVVIERVTATGVETTKTLTTHYTVSGGDGDSGTVTMLTAPAAGTTLTIYDDPSITQEIDLVENDPLPAETAEGGWDRLTLICQRLKDRIDRALRLTEGYAASFDPTLPASIEPGDLFCVNEDGDGFGDFPSADDRASCLLGFDAAGLPIAVEAADVDATMVSAFMSTVLDDTTAGAALTTLGLSSYGQQLSAVASAALARYLIQCAPAKNWVLNGNFDFWQRGTSFAAAADATYSADQWVYKKATTGAAHTVALSTDVPTFAESDFTSTNSILVDCTTADAAVAAGDLVYLSQRFEGHTWAQLRGLTCTLTFWVKATKTGTYCVSFVNGGSDRSYVAEYTVSVADTWEKKTVVVNLNPTGGTHNYDHTLGLYINWTLMGGSTYQTTAGAWASGAYFATSNQVNACDSTSNNFRLSQVQLVIGSAAPTQFQRAGLSIAGELALCQRYYEKSYDLAVDPGTAATEGAVFFRAASTTVEFPFPFKVTKRTTPTVSLYSTNGSAAGNIRDHSGTADVAATAAFVGTGSAGASKDTGGTDGAQYRFHWTANASL